MHPARSSMCKLHATTLERSTSVLGDTRSCRCLVEDSRGLLEGLGSFVLARWLVSRTMPVQKTPSGRSPHRSQILLLASASSKHGVHRGTPSFQRLEIR